MSCRETDHDGFDSVHEGEAEALEAKYEKLTQVSMLTWLGIVGLPQQTLYGPDNSQRNKSHETKILKIRAQAYANMYVRSKSSLGLSVFAEYVFLRMVKN